MFLNPNFLYMDQFLWSLPCTTILPPIYKTPSTSETTVSLPSFPSPLPLESEETEPAQPVKNRKGRRTLPDTLLFKRFRNLNEPYYPPKKEYLRIRVIRGLKRAIREVLEGSRLPKKGLHRVDTDNPLAVEKWKRFAREVKQNQDALKQIAKPKLNAFDPEERKRSNYACYNNAFCRNFLRQDAVKSLFGPYLDVVFIDMLDDELKDRFGFGAVVRNTKESSEDWEKIRQFLCEDMMKELQLEPLETRESGN